jgi:hypothetical protein
MANITLSVDDNVLQEVRQIAARKKTSVNALVRDHLTRLADQEGRQATARKRLLELADSSTGRMGPDWKWNREETYDRPVLSRHERPDLRGNRKS